MIIVFWAWLMGLEVDEPLIRRNDVKDKDPCSGVYMDKCLKRPNVLCNGRRRTLRSMNKLDCSSSLEFASCNGTQKNTSWEKILYKKQGVPDNYVPDSFLQDLKKNIHLQKYNLMEIIIATAVLTKQIASIVIFISMFVFFDTALRSEDYLPVLFFGTFLCTMALYICSVFVLPKTNMYLEIKRISIFLVSGFTLSPTLRTLTETISTDTIYFMVFIMMLIHFFLYNYGINVAIVSRPISLNAAFFASVCLASRLNTSFHVFLFLTLSIDLFVLLGIIYRAIPSVRARNSISICMALISLAMLNYTFHPVYCFLYVTLLLSINLVFPICFYKMQSYKDNIYGPWDEAIIDRTKAFQSPIQTPTSPILHNGASL